MVAWPAEYGVSGIKTFLVSHHGTVYEKDLGATTATLARALTRFNPDKTWKAVAGGVVCPLIVFEEDQQRRAVMYR